MIQADITPSTADRVRAVFLTPQPVRVLTTADAGRLRSVTRAVDAIVSGRKSFKSRGLIGIARVVVLRRLNALMQTADEAMPDAMRDDLKDAQVEMEATLKALETGRIDLDAAFGVFEAVAVRLGKCLVHMRAMVLS